MKQNSKSTPIERSDDPADPRAAASPAGSADPPLRRPARKASKREQLEYWLGHFAQIDLLTELPNRSHFLDRLSGAIARAVRNEQIVGVLLLNLDHLKALNAAHGHEIADLVLKKSAARLKDRTRKSDTIARIGGDEFAVILEGLVEKQGAAIAAQRLLEGLGRPLLLESGEISVTATVGVAFYPSDGDNVDMLLQNADTAMSHARKHNRSTCQFYSPEMRLQSGRDKSRRATIEQGLASLTPREREVLQILVAGNANKMIAYMLGTSTRTIDIHRAKIMDKMDARSLPELVRMVLDVQGAATGAATNAPQRQGRAT
jgi:diguanylate cyclase (GGDEF)-like protein